MNENIILYSKEGCPQCKTLKILLDKNKITYSLNSNTEEMISLGISSIPILEVNGIRMNNKEAFKWINERTKNFENR